MSTASDIFSSGDKNPKRLSPDQLQAYLDGKLTSEEQHEVEQLLSDQGLESDAVEGLQSLKAEDARESVEHLNRHLNKHLSKKRTKEKRYYEGNSWIWVAIVIVLLCCVLGYAFIHHILKN